MSETSAVITALSSDKRCPAQDASWNSCAYGSSHPLFSQQLTLETEMLNRGQDRYFATVSRCKEKGIEATTSYGKILLKHGIEPLSAAIRTFMTEADTGKAGRRHKALGMLKGMDTDVVAFIALRKTLDTLSKNVLMQRVAISVARELELEKKLTALQEQDKTRFDATQRHIKHSRTRKYRKTVLQYAFGKSLTVEFEPWPEADCVHLGHKIIELIIQSTGLFSMREAPYKHGRSAYVLEPSASCQAWVQRHQDVAAIMTPDYLPTLVSPKPWEGSGGGGYYSDTLRPLSLVKTTNTTYLEMLDKRIQAGAMPTVITAVNALQDTPWHVNTQTLAAAINIWDRTDGGVAGLPQREGLRLPPCPVCGADITDSASARVKHECLDTLKENNPEAFDAWKKQAALIREKNVTAFSQRLQTAKILTLARKYEDAERFYFPYQLDFRGRIYAVPAYLNPQGTDLAKGLLEFAEGKALGTMQAVRWLAIHGSNTWGNDKVSLDDRHSWVLQHQERILACAADPFNTQWWQDADSPFCFLSFCFEWAGYVREGLDFVSRIPVAMDGTCNGLQIFSLILRDAVGGAAVNLLPSDKPQDIYQIVADKVIVRLKEDAVNKELDADVLTSRDNKPLYNPYRTARLLLEMHIDRKTTKRQVMVLPYGGTLESCRDYTEEWIKSKIASGFVVPGNFSIRGVTVYLAGIIWEAIGTTVIAAREAMSFLQKVAGVCNKADLPIQWTSPAGLPVVQAYKEMHQVRIMTKIGDMVIKSNVSVEEYKNKTVHARRNNKGKFDIQLNPSKQRSAISPNYVHSLDASALMLTVHHSLSKGLCSFAMIHDSYGTLAADSETLAVALRGVFLQMFGGDVNHLAMWLREVLAAVPVELQADAPILPSMGTLDVNEVKNATFFFA